MSKGLIFDGSVPKLEIKNGSRTIYKLGNQMFELIGSDQTFTAVSTIFSDLTKNNLVYWAGDTNFTGVPNYRHTEGSTSFITAVAQEKFDSVDLMDVPAGADIFAGRLKLSRSNTPSTWMTRTIGVAPPQNKWMPFFGGASWILEAEFGFMRMLHLYIESGKLKLARQQSVSVAPAGCNQPLFLASSGAGVDHRFHVSTGGVDGLPVSTRGGSNPAAYTNFSPVPDGRGDRGGGLAPALSDNTNYSSTYSVDIVGRFGRRS